MRSADREALDLLKAATGRDVAPAVWAQIEQQVEQVGLRGLTGTSRTIVDHAVAKHGSHNQQSHAGGRIATATPKVGATVGVRGRGGRWKVKRVIPKAESRVGEDLFEVESGSQRIRVTAAKMTDAPARQPRLGLSAGRAGLDALYKEEGR